MRRRHSSRWSPAGDHSLPVNLLASSQEICADNGLSQNLTLKSCSIWSPRPFPPQQAIWISRISRATRQSFVAIWGMPAALLSESSASWQNYPSRPSRWQRSPRSRAGRISCALDCKRFSNASLSAGRPARQTPRLASREDCHPAGTLLIGRLPLGCAWPARLFCPQVAS